MTNYIDKIITTNTVINEDNLELIAWQTAYDKTTERFITIICCTLFPGTMYEKKFYADVSCEDIALSYLMGIQIQFKDEGSLNVLNDEIEYNTELFNMIEDCAFEEFDSNINELISSRMSYSSHDLSYLD